jgi:hypothetical protein
MMFMPAKTLNKLRAKPIVAAYHLEELAPEPNPIEDAECVDIKIATSITIDLIDMFGERRKRT